jgi:hypothetical protein
MPRFAPYGFARVPVIFYVPIPGGTTAADIVTAYAPGHTFTVEKVTAIVAVAGAGAGASRTLQVRKNNTVIASATVTLAGTATTGAQIDLPISGDATFRDGDTLSVGFASGGTAFTAGALNVVLRTRQRLQRER